MAETQIEMQVIHDDKKAQVWEFVFQGLNIGKWSIEKHYDGVSVVKNMKTVMCQKGGTLPLKEGCHLFDTKRFSQEQSHLNAAP